MPVLKWHSESSSDQAGLTSLLLGAARTGDCATIEALCAQGANVNDASNSGTTPLMIAARFGQLAAVRLLLDRGAAINTSRSDGFTALVFATFFGHEEIVRELVNRGADIHGKTRGGTSPDMWATARGFATIRQLLSHERFPFLISQSKPERLELPLPPSPANAALPAEPPLTKPAVELPLSLSPAKVPLLAEPPLPRPEVELPLSPTPANVTLPAEPQLPKPEVELPLPPSPANVALPAEAPLRKPEAESRKNLSSESSEKVVGASQAKPVAVGQIRDIEEVEAQRLSYIESLNSSLPFSPFSVLSARLRESWKPLGVVLLVLLTIGGVATVGALRRMKSNSRVMFSNQPAPVETVPATATSENVQTTSVEQQTQTVPANQTSPTSETVPANQTTSSADNASGTAKEKTGDANAAESKPAPAPQPDQPVIVENVRPDVAKQHVTRVFSDYPKARARSNKNRRQQSTTSDRDPEVGGDKQPAVPTIVPQQKQPSRAIRKELPDQTITPLQGSPAKRKVIQWP